MHLCPGLLHPLRDGPRTQKKFRILQTYTVGAQLPFLLIGALYQSMNQNANELPIPIQTKRAMAAELEGLIGQIRAGFVRISDLVSRARPLVKTIADTHAKT